MMTMTSLALPPRSHSSSHDSVHKGPSGPSRSRRRVPRKQHTDDITLVSLSQAVPRRTFSMPLQRLAQQWTQRRQQSRHVRGSPSFQTYDVLKQVTAWDCDPTEQTSHNEDDDVDEWGDLLPAPTDNTIRPTMLSRAHREARHVTQPHRRDIHHKVPPPPRKTRTIVHIPAAGRQLLADLFPAL